MSQEKLLFSNDLVSNHWTALPQLELRGMDTPFIESLFSYVMRLSHICNMRTNHLAAVLYSHSNAKKLNQRAVITTMSSWIGPIGGYEKLLIPLSRFTGQSNLHKGTFHAVSNVLHNRSMVSKHGASGPRHWCPKCYLEWNHDSSFEPLLWSFTLLSACPVHNVYMESKCISCGGFQPVVNEYDVRRICHKCSADLGHPGIPVVLSSLEAWINSRLLSFCGYIQGLDTPIPLSRYYDCLNGILKRKSHGEDLPPTVREYISTLNFKSRFSDLSVPTIDHYLNLCAFLGTTIEEILENPNISELTPLFNRSSNFTNIPFSQRSVKYNLRRIGLCMNELLDHREIMLPPITFLTKRFCVSPHNLRIFHPDILQKYKDRLQLEYEYLHRRAQRLALDYALDELDAEYDGFFDQANFSAFTINISEKTDIILPFAKSCAETAIVLHTIQHSLKNINNGSIEQNKELDAWIDGFFISNNQSP